MVKFKVAPLPLEALLKKKFLSGVVIKFPIVRQLVIEQYFEEISNSFDYPKLLYCELWKNLVSWTEEIECCLGCHAGGSLFEQYRVVNGYSFRVCHTIADVCLKPKSSFKQLVEEINELESMLDVQLTVVDEDIQLCSQCGSIELDCYCSNCLLCNQSIVDDVFCEVCKLSEK